jgi:hypothetical protein
MKNALLNIKAVQTGSYKAEIRAEAEFESRSRSGSQNKKFGSATLGRLFIDVSPPPKKKKTRERTVGTGRCYPVSGGGLFKRKFG